MKRRGGFLREMSGALSERDASSKSLFGSFYEAEVAIRNFERYQEAGPLYGKELKELDLLYPQLEQQKQGTPEYDSLKKRIDELRKIICEDSSLEPAGFGKTVSDALLKLKFGLMHMAYMIVLRLLIVVVNVAALVGLIYLLPTIVGWLF